MSNSFVTPWTVAHQDPLPMGFSRHKYQRGLPFPSPGELPNPGIEPGSPELAGRFFTAEPLGKPYWLCCCSVNQLCLTLCNPMDCSTPGFPVLHYLLELAQTHVHWVGEAIQPSHPLSSPSPPAFNLSQHQRLFRWVSSSHQVLKYWNFSFRISSSNEYSGLISFRIDWFDWLSKGLSRVFSNTTVQKHQFFGTQLSLWSNSHIHM